MRGDDQQLQTGMFSYVALEDRIPVDHPLRGVRNLVDAVLAGMSKDFDGLYSQVGQSGLAWFCFLFPNRTGRFPASGSRKRHTPHG